MNKLFSLLIVSTLIVSCAPKRGLEGQMSGSDETFTGEVHNFRDRLGSVDITSSKNVKCNGNFQRVQNTSKGVFYCNDGRSGPFYFTPNRTGGEGYGDLNGQAFSFTFGSYN